MKHPILQVDCKGRAFKFYFTFLCVYNHFSFCYEKYVHTKMFQTTKSWEKKVLNNAGDTFIVAWNATLILIKVELN